MRLIPVTRFALKNGEYTIITIEDWKDFKAIATNKDFGGSSNRVVFVDTQFYYLFYEDFLFRIKTKKGGSK